MCCVWFCIIHHLDGNNLHFRLQILDKIRIECLDKPNIHCTSDVIKLKIDLCFTKMKILDRILYQPIVYNRKFRHKLKIIQKFEFNSFLNWFPKYQYTHK